MANYANSLLVTAQGLLADKFSKPEMRHKQYSITEVMMKNTPVILPEIEMLKTSDQRAVEAYAFTKRATDSAAARLHNHTASGFGDTQKVALSYSTYAQKFKASLKMADRNFMTAAQMLANAMESAFINLMDSIEAANATYLNTNKTQVQAAADGELGTNDAVNHIWQIPQSSKDWMFQYLGQMLNINDYGDMKDVICDPVAFAIAQQLANQGGSNATNKGFQFNDMNLVNSTALTALAGFVGYVYAIPEGTVGALPWIPRVNRENVVTRLQTYTNMNDPFGLGLNVALHYYETADTTAATVGEVQDEIIQYEISIDWATVKAPLSTANETTIFKAGLLQ
jgi:hypothetical protein